MQRHRALFVFAVGLFCTTTTASYIARPNGRADTYQLLQAGDQLDMNTLLNAVSQLRQNAVPEIDGVYNCYLDPVSARQLFNDTAFRQLFQGATSATRWSPISS